MIKKEKNRIKSKKKFPILSFLNLLSPILCSTIIIPMIIVLQSIVYTDFAKESAHFKPTLEHNNTMLQTIS